MPLFSYKIQNTKGEIIEDTLQATSKEEAANYLQSNDYKVLTVKSLESKGLSFRSGIPVSEKAAFCRFLATMLRSGMPINHAVEIVAKETTNPTMKRVLTDVAFQTQKGKSLSAALSNYPKDFDPVFLTMIKAGEQSGTLEQSFNYLSKQMTAAHELSEKIKGSMMYPAVILIAMFGNGIVMMVFVLPRIAEAFLKLDVPLPIYTKILLTFGQFMGQNTLLALGITAVIGLLVVGFFVYSKTRQLVFNIITRIPVIRNIRMHIDLARFSRTLSTLLKSGVPVTDALDVSGASISQPSLKKEALEFSKKVERGESLSSILTQHRKMFPSIMVQTVRAGEESGSLEDVLEEMADFYEKEVEFSLKKFTSLLEPVLMLFIGVVVGGMVIIMIAPIYSIIGGLQSSISPGGN